MTASVLDGAAPPAEMSAPAGQSWPKRITLFKDPSPGRSLMEIIITVAPLVAFWAAMWAALQVSVWLCLALALPAGLFVVRLFMIQHDCGHGAFFRNRTTNDWVGRVLGILTLTPYSYWRQTHAYHHATVGNLDQRGMGDVTTLTVAEYRALGWRGRSGYWLYRHPFVMFGIGPAYLFFVQFRLPFGLMRGGWKPWVSTMGTNAAIAVVAAGMIWLVGLGPFLLIHIPIVLIAASIGVWLFYVQHQFEETTWEGRENWSHTEAALHGSSHYDLPTILRWLTANIGMHHLHHLSSRVPFYRLPEILRAYPELHGVGRITLLQSLRCVPLALWDESSRKLVSFKAARRSSGVRLDQAAA